MRRQGSLVAGNYKLLRRIGAGASGLVYLADDLAGRRRVALKFLRPELGAVSGEVTVFRREALILSEICHPHVVRALRHGADDRGPYLVTEYVRGPTLARRLQMGPSFAQSLELALQLCEAVGAVHARGFVHRDIKPENALVGRGPRLVLCDFGAARLAWGSPYGMVGTADYMAPEHADTGVSRSQDLRRCDVYALGMSIYELVAGQLPFEPGASEDVIRRHATEDPRPPSQLRPGLPPAADAVILRAIERDPGRRFQTCEELREALLILSPQECVESRPAARHPG